MNAYELAEKAEGLAYKIPADWSSGKPKNVATDIADMLHQQADRIAVLEANHKIQLNINDKALQYIAEWEKELQSAEVDIDVYRTEIAELKKDLKHTKFAWNMAENRIEELEKENTNLRYLIATKLEQTNAEPVAWMLTLPDGTHDWILDGRGCDGYVPLYATPQHASDVKQTKRLSDEEIDYCWTHSHGNTDWMKKKAFARAILRKAQEK